MILALVSALLARVMMQVGALDHPVARSSHTAPTPKGGGVGIVAAYALGMAWLVQSGQIGVPLLIVLLAALVLAGVSYADDVRNWPFTVKLAAQIAAALAAVAAGTALPVLELPGGFRIDIGLAAPLLVLAWLLFVTNAVNFIDGLNGLASGSVAIALLALCIGAPHAIAAQAGLVSAGIAGFLPFNFPAARIFMGDVGSQTCGFLAADLAFQAASDPASSLIVPLALLPVLADVAFTLLRRAASGQRLTAPHRGHLYQVAHRAGVPAWRVTVIYWGMAAWGGAAGLAAGALQSAPWSASAAAAVAALPIALWAGYVVRKTKQAGLTTW